MKALTHCVWQAVQEGAYFIDFRRVELTLVVQWLSAVHSELD